MNWDSFKSIVKADTAPNLASRFLDATEVVAFAGAKEYQEFLDRVRGCFGNFEMAAVVGSGNWRYSLNPEKNFRAYHERSDVDVAIVWSDRFHSLWEEMRAVHRDRYHRLSRYNQDQLRRSGENVYSGFITPDWIPYENRGQLLKFKRLLNQLSDATIGYRPVKVMFFKNKIEAIDYYSRGFHIAKKVTR